MGNSSETESTAVEERSKQPKESIMSKKPHPYHLINDNVILAKVMSSRFQLALLLAKISRY